MTAPERIYLQDGGYPEDAPPEYEGNEGMTWCTDRMEADDTEYLRADVAEAMVARYRDALRELHAMVMGECPSLLNEDSGGCARLDLEVRALLEEKMSQFFAQSKSEAVTRFEVIDESGRTYVRHGVRIRLVYQDDGRTLKVFLEARALLSEEK